MNPKKLLRLYHEEGLAVHLRCGRKRTIIERWRQDYNHVRQPCAAPFRPRRRHAGGNRPHRASRAPWALPMTGGNFGLTSFSLPVWSFVRWSSSHHEHVALLPARTGIEYRHSERSPAGCLRLILEFP